MGFASEVDEHHDSDGRKKDPAKAIPAGETEHEKKLKFARFASSTDEVDPATGEAVHDEVADHDGDRAGAGADRPKMRKS